MIVKGYRTQFQRDSVDKSDNTAAVLSRLTPLFTATLPTLQPREEMAVNVRGGAPDANYITIEYDDTNEPQKLAQKWYYFAEYDAGSPATPAGCPFRLSVDWWAMCVQWGGEDPPGIQIKRGHLTRSHQFITESYQGGNTTLANAPANPRKLISVQTPAPSSTDDAAAIVALYHVNGSIFALPGTDKYLQVIIPLSIGESTQNGVADALAYLANGKTVTYTVNYTDEEGKAQTYTETPDISECAGLWIIPRWIVGNLVSSSLSALSHAVVTCRKGTAASAVVPVGLYTSKTYNAWAVTSDCTDNSSMTIAGDLKHFRYFGNPGANIVLPCTLDALNGVIITRFSMAQQSFSVKFAAAGSVVDATNSFAVNISKENADIQFRNDIIKGGISTIVTAIGAAVGGSGGAALALAGITGAAGTVSAGIGLANSSRHSEGMDGLENMVAIDYSTTAENKYIYGCAVVTYDPDNKAQVDDEYNDFGALGAAETATVSRDTDHNYIYYQFDGVQIANFNAVTQRAKTEIERMLNSGVRIWHDDVTATNFLNSKTWQ